MTSPTTSARVSPVDSTGRRTLDSLLFGTKWGGEVGSGVSVSYSFPAAGAVWSTSYSRGYGATFDVRFEPWHPGYQPLTAGEAADTRQALRAWSDVSGLRFVEVDDGSRSVGDIRFAYTGVAGPNVLAHAYLPAAGAAYSGDVWLSSHHRADHFADTSPGSDAHRTLLHEIGHAVGLGHPFDGRVRLPDRLDSLRHTVMSYEIAPGVFDNGSLSIYPTTPMSLDIDAIQHLYGANTRLRAGDTTYRFDSDGRYFQTLWDAGGRDTIVVDGDDGAIIDLRPGRWSALGLPLQYSDGSVVHTDRYTVNIYRRTTIENAVGGEGDDVVIGNAVANRLRGGGGDDRLSGYAGDDRLYGDAGADRLVGAAGRDRLYGGEDADRLYGGADADLLYGQGGDDILSGQHGADRLVGGAGDDHLHGGGGGDRLYGQDGDDRLTGASGDDLLVGGAGDDTLNGGGGTDRLVGGPGDDLYILGDRRDRISDSSGEDTVRVGRDYRLPSFIENAGLSGSGSHDLTGNGRANHLVGNRGRNVLDGGGGDDFLDGGPGADVLRGGAGNDRYVVDHHRDRVEDTRGTDTVESSIDYRLPGAIEHLVLTGTRGLRGTGNARANRLDGNDGDNLLRGEAGNDVLTGGAGADVLAGGSGFDVFVFDQAPGAAVDRITDFVSGIDRLWLSQAAFPLLPVTGTLPLAADLLSLDGFARDADDRLVFDPGTGALAYDADGSGAGTAVEFVRIDSLLVGAGDIFVV